MGTNASTKRFLPNSIWLRRSSLLLIFFSVGCTASPLITTRTRRQPTDAEAAAVAFLADPAYRNLSLSPDGTKIAAIRSTGESDSIVLLGVDGDAAERVLVEERRSGYRTRGTRVLRQLGWPSNDRIVYSIETPYVSEEDGIEIPNERSLTLGASSRTMLAASGNIRKTRLYSIGLAGPRKYLGKRWPRADVSMSQDWIVSWLPNDPDHFLVEYQGDVLRVDSHDGSFSIAEAQRNGMSSWAADYRGEIRAAWSFTTGTRETGFYARASSRDDWKRLTKNDRYLEKGFWFADFSEDSDRIYVYSDQHTDKAALYEYDIGRNQLGREVFRDPDYDIDVGWLQSSPIDGRLLAIHYARHRPVVEVVDPEWQGFWSRITKRFPQSALQIASFDASGRKMLLMVSSDRSPSTVYFHDVDSGEFRLVTELYPDLLGKERALAVPTRFRARDGVEIEAFISNPPSKTDETNRVIIIPHGGPETRDVIAWDPAVQFLVMRGFTVVRLNYRGSIGYGRDHERGGDLEWGHAVQNDIADATNFLIGEGIATPGRIGIFGIGHGGYLALQALVSHPEVYQAGASWGGETDLVVKRRDDWDTLWDDSASDVLVGSALTDRNRLIETSPARQAERITVPVLLGHGTDDPAVDPKHLSFMAHSLRSAGAEFEAYRYENELDDFIDPRSRVDFYLRLADFFDRHLGDH
jgi:dipeptidyl aminopeptidase/acylaminoacyl peptidase